MAQHAWMIYGANGFTGELIAREAQKRGLKPLLAGRRASALQPLAQELGFEFVVFGLENPAQVAELLRQHRIHTVLHCAGPFSATSAPMVEACLQAKANYLDITGEISVFEAVRLRHAEAVKAGVLLAPGVGFDVVPSDSLALALKKRLPDANHLTLAIKFSGAASVGTTKSMIEGLKAGGRIRREGKLTEVPFAYKIQTIPFAKGPLKAVTIPWGDVSTAYYSTGIPNIEVYMALPTPQVAGMVAARYFKPILSLTPVQDFMKGWVEKAVPNPSAEHRQRSKSYLWGEVTNARGDKATAHLITPNGYDLTVTAALGITEHLLKAQNATGFLTPASLMGETFITTLPGTQFTWA